MDITKRNFVENIEQIDEQISDCDFVSIDCEFSGLFQNQRRNNELDNYEQLYLNTRTNINQFQIFQFGLSLFKKLPDDYMYDCYSYNFYIFPTKCIFLPEEQRERCFLCQSSSLTFLVDNGFDFNRMIRDGITYIPLNQLSTVETKINAKIQENQLKTNFIEIEKDEDKKFLEELNEKLNKFMSNDEQQEEILPQCNSYYRRIIYETVQKSSFKDSIQISTGKQDNKGSLILKKGTPKPKDEQTKSLLFDNIGFTLIIKSLIKHQKPIIGHSLFFDLLHIYNLFIEPLPEKYDEFKLSIKSLFNSIYDTAYISLSPKLKNFFPQNALKKVFETVKNEPFLGTKFSLKNSSNFDDDNRYHEAGYDSFITGCCFVQMIRYLCEQENLLEDENLLNNKISNEFRNKISIFGNYDIKFLNLQGNDEPLNRNHIFHLNFSKSFTRNDLNGIFSEFGGLYRIVFLDDESAFCIMKDENKIGDAIEALIINPKGYRYAFKIQHYSEFMKQQKTIINHDRDNSSPQMSQQTPKSSAKLKQHHTPTTTTTPEPIIDECLVNKKIKLNTTSTNIVGGGEKNNHSSSQLVEKLFDDNMSWTNDCH
ncbi:poly(A)-specific ribonuclease PARN-like [Dermatophagoides pteronyssinus]|uniref:poly(A)-specific ribonuclease PARN-like n=1 Tax=Dermatophagoides pteronyssinus TaxID=6956 RepID=UPI003F662FFE